MPIRVLALCGFTQNAHIYSKQLGAIRKSSKQVEFVFLDPPIVLQKADMPWNQNLSDFNSSASTEEEKQTPETTPRAWWLTNDDRSEYKRFEETLAYIHDFLVKSEPFDGIMGFSQGGCMAAVLAALLENPGFSPHFPTEPSIQKFKFCIFVGGFLPAPKSPDFSSLFPLPATLPTVHITGKNDVVVTPERSQSLIDACLNKRVEVHDGGHFTPSKASWRHWFSAYTSSFLPDGSNGDVPSPSAYGPSGANTPTTGPSRPTTPPPSNL